MTSISPIINNRKILYLHIKDSLDELIAANLSNWVLFVIEDNIHNPILSRFAEKCIDKNILYMCATGQACSEVDDLFDMVMVMRREYNKLLPTWYKSDDDVLMTTWDYDFDEGFWFCTKLANYEDHPIDTVLVVNLTDSDYLPKIEDLANRISKGWLPPD